MNARRPPILALRPALYAVACVLGAWMLSHMIIGGLLVMALSRCPARKAATTHDPPEPAPHDTAAQTDYPF